MLQGYETFLQRGSNISPPYFLSESKKQVVLGHKNNNRTLLFFVLFCSTDVKDIVLWINRPVVYISPKLNLIKLYRKC